MSRFKSTRWYHVDVYSEVYNEFFSTKSSDNSSLCNPLSKTSGAKDGGLPLVLAVNIAIGAVIFFVFLLMHCCLKDFVMAAVKPNKRWPPLLSRLIQEDSNDENEDEDESTSEKETIFAVGKNYCEAIIKFLTMSEFGVRMRSGPDASLYLIMELYLLAILCVYSFFSITFILPINYLSGDLQTTAPFARTTVSNLSGQSPALWSHVIFSLLYVIIAGIFMLHYSVRLGKNQRNESLYTVMINGVPQSVYADDLKQHFVEAVPGTQVVDARFAYNIRGLYKKWKECKDVMNHLKVAEAYSTENKKQLMVHKRPCVCCDKPVNAKEYYTSKLNQLKVAVAMERGKTLAKKLSIAFVTFTKKVTAKRLVDMYKPCKRKPESSLTDSINSNKWSLSLAPYSRDLLWENLACHPAIWWIRSCLINAIVIIFLVFFTTPPVLLNSAEELWLILQKLSGNLNVTNRLIYNVSRIVPGFIQSYISSFLLWILGTIMSWCIVRSVYLEFYWSKTTRQQTILRKTYVIQVLQVIVLPSLGLTSLSALAALVLHQGNRSFDQQLSCVFLPNNGAFFVSYVIIATFVFSPLELLRFPQLLEYLYRRCQIKTRFERKEIYQKILACNEFKLGIQYSYNLHIFTLVTAFSLTTPLIVPFGALFFAIKYLVDKYNLLYGYQPTHISGRQYLHKTALKCVIVGTLFLQLVTLFYAIVREGKVQPRAIVMMIMIILTGIILFGILVMGWLTYLLPRIRLKLGKEYAIFGYEEEDDKEVEPGEYIPPTLQETANEISYYMQNYQLCEQTETGDHDKISPIQINDDVLGEKFLLEDKEKEEEINMTTKDD